MDVIAMAVGEGAEQSLVGSVCSSALLDCQQSRQWCFGADSFKRCLCTLSGRSIIEQTTEKVSHRSFSASASFEKTSFILSKLELPVCINVTSMFGRT